MIIRSSKKNTPLLLLIAPLILAEAVMQASYFRGLQPEVITSCCGTQFTARPGPSPPR